MNLNDLLFHIRQSISGMVPELFLACLLVVVLLSELIAAYGFKLKETPKWMGVVAGIGALILLGLCSAQWNEPGGFRFGSFLFLDQKAVFYKFLVVFAWLFTLVHLRVLNYRFPVELQALLITSVLGLLLLCMATNLLSIYLCVELLSISSYLMVALSPTRKAAEGSLKYLLFGTVSSAAMLYGISLIYGLTGTLDITDPAIAAGLVSNPPLVMNVAMVLTLAGILFKMSLAPFHVWTPDVYEAAPTPLVSFLSVAPKAAILLVLMRLVSALPDALLPTLGGIALISITLGNVTALLQQNARRLLAYSSIAQAGYLLVGVVAFSQFGFQSATFYVASFVLINMSAFFVIDVLQPRSDTNLTGFSGLGRRYVVAGLALTLVLVALAGLPPTVGFTAKWLVFSALWDSYSTNGHSWALWLLTGGIINAAIALVYYLKLPFLLFFRQPTETQSQGFLAPVAKMISGLLLLLVVLLFFAPGILSGWIEKL